MSTTPHSDSGAFSDATQLPQDVAKAVFGELFNGALVYGILKSEDLLKRHTPLKVLESIEDRERVADIVHASIGTMRAIILARYDVRRFAEDIDAGIKADPSVAKCFIEALGVDYFLECMSLEELYGAVMETLWMTRDEPMTRAYAASLCSALVKNNAFGSPAKTLEHIATAITDDVLMSDAVPHGLRTRLFSAMRRGSRKYPTKYLAEYLFEETFNGVPLTELAEHLPVEPLARPFAAFVDSLGIIKTHVERPSELPPSDHPDMKLLAAPPPVPPAPKIPKPPGVALAVGSRLEDVGQLHADALRQLSGGTEPDDKG